MVSWVERIDRAAELSWICGDERRVGGDVLDIARPGLRLVDETDIVPRPVFFDWVCRAAERLLRANIGYGHLVDHEGDWLVNGIAILKFAHDPSEFDDLRGHSLMLMASLNTFGAIRGGAREMGDVYRWTSDALQWATKHVHHSRWCAHDPVTLMRSARDLHAELARRQALDETAAVETERRAQVESLLESWRDADE